MRTARIRFDLFLVCSIVYAGVFFAWIIFLFEIIESNEGSDSILIVLTQLVVVGVALLTSIARKPGLLLAFSFLSFFPLGLYMLGGEGWAQLTGMASFLCVILSAWNFWLQRKRKAGPEKNGSL